MHYLKINIKTKCKEKCFIFCIDQIINSIDGSAENQNKYEKLTDEYLKLIFDETIIARLKSSVNMSNKILHILYKSLKLEEYEDVKMDKFKKNAFELDLQQKLDDNQFFKKMLILMELFLKISIHHVQNESLFKINGLNYFLNLVAIIDSNRSLEIKISDEFLNFSKQFLKINYEIQFDSFLIIRHQLFKFETIIREEILNENNIISQNELKALLSAKENLLDIDLIYLILKKLNTLNDSTLKTELTQLIWYLFENVSIEERLLIIHNVYCKNDIKLDNDNFSVSCLMNDNFNNDLIMTINQLSAENYQDILVSFLLREFLSNAKYLKPF